MNRLLYILLFLVQFTFGYAQKSGMSVTGGIGTYQLAELKTYQDYLISLMPVEVKGLSYFPPFTSLKASLFRQEYEGLKYGLEYAYSTTGAHANYSDISGELNVNQSVSAFQVGPVIGYKLVTLGFFEIAAYGGLRLSYLVNEANMNIITDNFYYNNSIKFRTVSPFGEAGLEMLLNFSRFSAGIEGGYVYNPGIKMIAGKETFEEPLISLLPENNLKSNLSGARMGLKLILWLTD